MSTIYDIQANGIDEFTSLNPVQEESMRSEIVCPMITTHVCIAFYATGQFNSTKQSSVDAKPIQSQFIFLNSESKCDAYISELIDNFDAK